MALRYAGQDAVVACMNSTTGDQMLPDMNIESISFSFPFELTKKEFIGENGPTFREFADGWEAEIKFEPNDPDQVVAWANALKAKAESASSDEFFIPLRFNSPDTGSFRVVLKDAHFELGLDGQLGGRTDFLTSTIKAKGKTYKINTV